MEKNKKMIGIAVIALVISLISVGIAFAALSQDLTINGGAEFNPASWKVRFKDLSLSKNEGGAGTGTEPTLTATTIGTYAVSLTKPGDYVRYTFNVENDGTLDAKIASFTKNAPTCTGTGSTAVADANLVCTNLIYTLTYTTHNGTPVAMGNTLAKKTGTATQAVMVLNIEYPSSMTAVPENDVTIAFPEVVITYEQD